jgi:hypothetical protein
MIQDTSCELVINNNYVFLHNYAVSVNKKKSYNFKMIHPRCVLDKRNHRQIQSNITIPSLGINSATYFGLTGHQQGGNNGRLDTQLLS